MPFALATLSIDITERNLHSTSIALIATLESSEI